MPRKSIIAESGYTVLVVDDEDEALISVRQLLEREGHRVLTAESGEQGLALFKEQPVHLVLVEYFMPRMTGEQLVRELRVIDPFVQIVMRTGYAGEKPPLALLADLEIQGYHDKSEGPEKLLLWVDVGLKAHRMIRSLREREQLHVELVANVSHEFRTPLNIIGGYTALLLEGVFGALPSSTEPPLRSVVEATDNLTELVSDFLNYAKIEARAAEVAAQRIPIDELARDFERLGAVLLEGKEVRFRVESADAPAAIVSDSVKLRTILRNLMTNAVKFTAAGEITMRIARHGAEVRFSVRDTGPGIMEQDIAVIFEPFRQLEVTRRRNRNGTGLGLALSRKLARILGGDIEVESQRGAGSMFTLVLPLPAELPGYIVAAAATESVSLAAHSRPSLLYA